MSANGFAAMSTKRLLQLFVEAAKSTPTIYAEWRATMASGMVDKFESTPERDARVATVKALGAALAARKPIPGIRPLLKTTIPMFAPGRPGNSSESILCGHMQPWRGCAPTIRRGRCWT